MVKTKYSTVYKDDKTGKFYYNIELGVDRITGKRIQKKGSRSQNGSPFKSAKEAYEEVIRLKKEYHERNGYSNYNIKYGQFMKDVYLKYYQTSVEESTWRNRLPIFESMIKRFGNKKLRNITISDCEYYRTYLLTETGFSQSYCALIYGMFRKSLDYAVRMQYISDNISKRTKAIAKGKAHVAFWEKSEFEKVINTFYIQDYKEHMNFVLVWVYYVTGIRVSEGLALQWKDVDLKNKKLKIHYNLDYINRENYSLKPYLKTENGRRTISIDDTTVEILSEWKERQSKNNYDKFIFSYNEEPLARSIVNRIISKHAELAGVTSIQAKGLRHSHASYLINEHNADILVISQRLGHSSPEITLKHYAHLWSKNDESIAEMITGNIKIRTSEHRKSDFSGNQYINSEGYK